MLKIGGKFGDYTVEALLGQGGMGEVYLIRGAGGGAFAVKVMTPPEGDEEHEFRRRFAREAEIAMKVEHRNLIKVYDVGEDPETGLCYIIMDYVPGGSVAQKLKAQGRLSIEEALTVTVKIAAALGKAHKAGVVHRDIKPDNIMFDADGTPKLADLGIAKFEDGREATQLTSTGMVIGTPAYMAPEQMLDSHNVTPKADIYSLGMVLYEMLTGERPHGNSSLVEMMSKALKGEELRDVRELRPEVPDELAKVLKKMCARNPEERPADTQEVMKLLNEAAEKMRTRRGGPGAKVRLALRRMRFKKSTKRIVRVVLGLLVAAAMVGVGIVAGSLDNMVEGADEIDRFADLQIDRLDLDNGENLVIEAEEKAEEVPMEAAPAEEAPEEEVKFKYEAEGDGVAIAGIEGEARPGKLTIPDMIEGKRVASIKEWAFANCQWLRQVQVTEGVKCIKSRAFINCKALEDVYVPDSVETIGEEAFKNCTSLKRLRMPKRMKKLELGIVAGCTALESLELPEGIEQIDMWLCSDCSALKAVTIPSSVKIIKYRAFMNCTALEELRILDGVETIETEVFKNCSSLKAVTIPSSGKTIKYQAFANCTALEELRILDGVETIGTEAFKNCTSLKRLKMPKRLSKLEVGAVAGCTELESLELPEGIEQIDMWLFADCSSLRTVTIPSSVKIIKYRAFANCTALETISIPDSVDRFEGEVFKNCGKLKSARLPEKMSKLGYGSFAGCAELKSLELPEGIEHIEAWLCSGCKELKTIKMPDSAKSIEHTAFGGCKGLKRVEIGKGIEIIKDNAFNGCTGLEAVMIPGGVTNISNSAFANAARPGCRIYANSAVKNRFRAIFARLQEGTKEKIEVQEEPDDDDQDDEQEEMEDTPLKEGQKVWNGLKYSTLAGRGVVIEGVVKGQEPKKLLLPYVIDGARVYRIGREAFAGCKRLEYVSIPGGVEKIEEKAFYGCKNLRKVEVDNSLTMLKIGKNAFAKCTSMYEITFGNRVEKIGKMAFAHCRSLQRVDFPESVTSIAPNAFYGCAAIRNVTMPPYLCSKNGMRGLKYAFPHSYAWITDVEVTPGTKEILNGAFGGCIRLKRVTIPGSMEYIEQDAFDLQQSSDSLTVYMDRKLQGLQKNLTRKRIWVVWR